MKPKPEVRPPKISRTSCIKICNEFSYLLHSAYIPNKENLLVQWSSDISVPQTSLKGLFRYRSLDTNSRAYDWIGLWRTQRFLGFVCNTVSPPTPRLQAHFQNVPTARQWVTQKRQTWLGEGGHREVLSEYTEHFHVFPLRGKDDWP